MTCLTISPPRLNYLPMIVTFTTKDLDQLCSWKRRWQMKFNTEKCFTLKVSNSHSPFTHSYSLNNTPLAETTSHTYLGVELSNNLKWNKHVDHITAKGNRSLGFINCNLNRCTEDIKSLAYRSLVRPSLEYCRGCVMWGQGVYGAQILVLVHKFTFQVVLGVIFFP